MGLGNISSRVMWSTEEDHMVPHDRSNKTETIIVSAKLGSHSILHINILKTTQYFVS